MPPAATHPLPLAAPYPLLCGHFRVALQAYRRLPSSHNDSYLLPCSKQSFWSTERSFNLFPCSDSVFLSTQFRVSRAVPRFFRSSAFPAQFRVSFAVLRFPRRRNGEGLMFLLRERKCALKGFGSAHEESVRAGVPPVHQGAVREGIWPWRATSLAFRDSVGIRTQDPQLRRLLLYPTELRNRPSIQQGAEWTANIRIYPETVGK